MDLKDINEELDDICLTPSYLVDSAELCIQHLGSVNNNLTILSQNIRSIRQNLDKLLIFIKDLTLCPI